MNLHVERSSEPSLGFRARCFGRQFQLLIVTVMQERLMKRIGRKYADDRFRLNLEGLIVIT